MTRLPLIPQSYLGRFADEAGQVLIEARDRSRRLLASPEAAAERTGTFTVAPAGGSAAALAALLRRVEDGAVGAVDRMLAGAFPPTGEHRACAALFVACLILRGRQHRAGVAAVLNHLFRILAEDPAVAAEGDPTPVVTETEPRTESVQLALSNAPELARLLSARTWQLIRFPRPILLTGDTPAVLWSRAKAPMPFGVRLGAADEVRVPLGPQHALILARHAPAGEVTRELGDRHAAALNRTVAEAAHEWMFYHPASDPMEEVELPPP